MRPLRLPLCPRCGDENSTAGAGKPCRSCPRGELYFTAARAATVYEGPAVAILERFKYRARAEYAPFIASKMLAALTKYYANEKFDALVPVPLHPARRRERGYNQAELLAKAMAAETGFPVIANELRRIRATPSQTKLDRHARAENVKDAFALAKDPSFTGLKILLVDDVYTTGATLNECARMLREAGAASVFALTFCRATLL